MCSMARLDLLAWVLEPSRINFIFRRSGLQMYSQRWSSYFRGARHPPGADGPRSSRDGTWRCRLENPHVCLLCLRCVVLSFRLKSAHRRSGVGPGVGSRDGHANELQSTPCVIRPPLPAAVVRRT
jgi:hypothetical protein